MYELLSGETIDLTGITAEARAYLDELGADIAAGLPYFDLELGVKGPRAFTTKNSGGFVTKDVLADPVYRVANDLVTRVGIQQGKVGAPRNAPPAAVPDGMISVAEAASMLGQSRQNVNAAIKRGRLAAQMIGGVYLLRVDDVREYQRQAEQRGAPGRSPTGKVSSEDELLAELGVNSAKEVTLDRSYGSAVGSTIKAARAGSPWYGARVGDGEPVSITQSLYYELLSHGATEAERRGPGRPRKVDSIDDGIHLAAGKLMNAEQLPDGSWRVLVSDIGQAIYGVGATEGEARADAHRLAEVMLGRGSRRTT